MAQLNRKKWLDKIGKWVLNVLPGDNDKPSDQTNSSQTVQTSPNRELSVEMIINSRPDADGVTWNEENTMYGIADKKGQTSNSSMQTSKATPEVASEKTLIEAWRSFELAWENAGLDDDYFLKDEELVNALSILDQSFEKRIITCLTKLNSKPETLRQLAVIIKQGNKVSATDDIEAIRAFPYVSVAISPKNEAEGWESRSGEVIPEGKVEYEEEDNASQAQLGQTMNGTWNVSSVPRETNAHKTDQTVEQLGIEELGLTTRTINSLKRLGIHKLTDLADRDEESLKNLKNLGSSSIDEICDGLIRVGLILPFSLDTLSKGVPTQARGSDENVGKNNNDNPELKELGLSTRTLNCLYRAKFSHLSDLRLVTEGELLNLQNFGATALEELRQCLSERGQVILFESHRKASIESSKGHEIQLDGLDTLKEWSNWTYSNPIITLADVLALDSAVLPEDVRAEREKLLNTVLSEGNSGRPDPNASLDDLRVLLDPRHIEILDQRSWSESPVTLKDIASELDLSRERVRQLQQKAQKALQLYILSNRNIRWLLHQLRYEIGSLASSETIAEVFDRYGVTTDTLYGRMLLDLAGPYTVIESGFVRLAGTDDLEVLMTKIQSAIGFEGHIEHQALAELIGKTGLRGEKGITRFLEKLVGLKRFEQQWYLWKGSSIDKAFVVLKVYSTSITAKEIAVVIGEGHSERTLNNGMSDDKRFIRTGKRTWGLTEWGCEEYSGIVEEIFERILAKGGSAEVQWLVDDIVNTFDVAENSVRLYLDTFAFIVENDMVRRRTEKDGWIVDTSLSVTRGTYRIGTSIRYEVRVSKDVLRGSGQAIPAGTAIALGVSPGAKISFSSKTGDEVLVGWRLWSTSGPDIGSIRLLANKVGASNGDYLVLVFDTIERTVEARVLQADLDKDMALKLLVDANLNSDKATILAEAIEVSRGEVRSTLRARGDERIAELLTQRHDVEDEGLRAAIGDLLDELK